MKKLTFVLPIILLLGCSSGVSISYFGQDFILSGSWSGVIISDTVGGSGSISIVFSQETNETTVAGTASIIGHPCFSGGAITGTAVNGTVNIDVEPASSGTGSATVSLAMTGTGNFRSISGIYQGVNSIACPSGDNGNWSISR